MPVLLRVHRMRRDAPAEGPRLLRFLLIWLRSVPADAELNSYDPTNLFRFNQNIMPTRSGD
jgi:Berberine and berberine like